MKSQGPDPFAKFFLTPAKRQSKFKEKHQIIIDDDITPAEDHTLIEKSAEKETMTGSHNESTILLANCSCAPPQKDHALTSNQHQDSPLEPTENNLQQLKFCKSSPIDFSLSSFKPFKIPIRQEKNQEEDKCSATLLFQPMMMDDKLKTEHFDPSQSESIQQTLTQYNALLKKIDQQPDVVFPKLTFFTAKKAKQSSELTQLLLFKPNLLNGRNICFDQKSQTCVSIYKCYGCVKTFKNAAALGGHISKCPFRPQHQASAQRFRLAIKMRRYYQPRQGNAASLSDGLRHRDSADRMDLKQEQNNKVNIGEQKIDTTKIYLESIQIQRKACPEEKNEITKLQKEDLK